MYYTDGYIVGIVLYAEAPQTCKAFLSWLFSNNIVLRNRLCEQKGHAIGELCGLH